METKQEKSATEVFCGWPDDFRFASDDSCGRKCDQHLVEVEYESF